MEWTLDLQSEWPQCCGTGTEVSPVENLGKGYKKPSQEVKPGRFSNSSLSTPMCVSVQKKFNWFLTGKYFKHFLPKAFIVQHRDKTFPWIRIYMKNFSMLTDKKSCFEEINIILISKFSAIFVWYTIRHSTGSYSYFQLPLPCAKFQLFLTHLVWHVDELSTMCLSVLIDWLNSCERYF